MIAHKANGLKDDESIGFLFSLVLQSECKLELSKLFDEIDSAFLPTSVATKHVPVDDAASDFSRSVDWDIDANSIIVTRYELWADSQSPAHFGADILLYSEQAKQTHLFD